MKHFRRIPVIARLLTLMLLAGLLSAQNTVHYTATSANVKYLFATAEPVAHLKSGDILDTNTLDCFGGALRKPGDTLSMVKGDNPLSGPFFVEGAEPGDTLAVKILDLQVDGDTGVGSFSPGFGGLNGTHYTPVLEAPLPERILLPALNVRGLSAGHVGAQAANAIPTEARASIDIRLVPDQKTKAVREAVERHLTALGYFIVRDEPDLMTRLAHPRIVRVEWKAGYPGVRIAMDQPFARAVGAVVAEGLGGTPIVNLPILGGSLPLATLKDLLRTPVVIVPIVNHDNNQHAANENLRLRNLWDGIQVFAALFTRLGPAWT